MAIQNTYDYSQLKKEIINSISDAVISGGEEGFKQGLQDLMSRKLSLSGVTINTKELQQHINDQINAAFQNVDISPKLKKTRGINLNSLISLDEKDLTKRINDIVNNLDDDNISDTQFTKLSNEFVTAVTIALNKGLKLSEDILEEYKYNLNEFGDTYKKFVDNINKQTDSNDLKIFNAFQESLAELKNSKAEFSNILSDINTKGLSGVSLKRYEKIAKGVFSEVVLGIKSEEQAIEELNKYIESHTGQNKMFMIADENDTVLDFAESVKETNAYLQKENDLLEEQAILLKDGVQAGKEFSNITKTGAVNIGDSISELNPDAVLHTHPFDSLVDNLRFSDADIEALVTGEVERLYLLCGNQLETMDISGVKDVDRLRNDILDIYNAVFLRYGAELNNGKITGIENLSNEAKNQATSLINKYTSELVTRAGGDLYFAENLGNGAWEDITEQKLSVNPQLETITSMLDAMNSGIKERVTKLQSELGVLNSLKEEISKVDTTEAVQAAATKMTTTAEETVAKTQDSHSPSRVARELGEMFGEGYADGIKDSTEEVAEAVKQLVTNGVMNLSDLQGDLDKNITGDEDNRWLEDGVQQVVDELREEKQAIEAVNTVVNETPTEKITEEVQALKEVTESVEKQNEAVKENKLSEIAQEQIESLQKTETATEELKQTTTEALNPTKNVLREQFKETQAKAKELKTEIAEIQNEIDLLNDSINQHNSSNFSKYVQNSVNYGEDSAKWNYDQFVSAFKTYLSAKKSGDENAEAKYWEKASVYYGRYFNLVKDGEDIIHPTVQGVDYGKDLYDNYERLKNEYLSFNEEEVKSSIQTLQAKRSAKSTELILAENTASQLEEQSRKFVETKKKEVKAVEEVAVAQKEQSKTIQSTETTNLNTESLEKLSTYISSDLVPKINAIGDAFKANTLIVDNSVLDYISSLEKLSEKLKEISIQIDDISTVKINGDISFTGFDEFVKNISNNDISKNLLDIADNVLLFTEIINTSKVDNTLLESINSLTNKGEELKDLITVLNKASKLDTVVKATSNEKQQVQTLKQEKSLEEGIIEANQKREKVLQEEQKIRRKLAQLSSSETIETQSATDAEKEREKVLREEQEIRNKLRKLQEQSMDTPSLDKLGETISKLSESGKYASSFINKIEESYNKLKSLSKTKNLTPDIASSINEQVSELNKEIETQKQLKNVSNSTYVSLANISSKVSKTLNENTSMTQGLRNEYTSLFNTIENYRETGNFTNEDFTKVVSQFKSLDAALQKAGKTGLSTFDTILKRTRQMSINFVAMYLSLYDIVRYLRSGLTVIKEIDTAITELRKVSNAAETELNGALESATATAKELGSSISDIVSAQADWSRLGYSLEDSEDLAYATQLYVNVGDDIDVDSANEYLISTLQGYQLEADTAISIIDKINEVANNYAIDSAGIGEALERSAASFYAANTSLSESIALITTANAVVQDPDSVGTTFKTLSARIRGAETELEELGEETDEYTSSTSSKLRNLVKSLTGFDIMEDENTYKSIYEILLGIGKEWGNLTDLEQASLGEALAGKRNANVLYAVMNNIDDLESVYNTAESSEGSALKEQENYEKSIEYSTQVFIATLEDLVQDLIDSGLVKQIIDLGTEGVEIIDTIVEHAGVLGVVFTSISGISLFKDIKSGSGLLGMIAEFGATAPALQNAYSTLELLDGSMLDLDTQASMLGKAIAGLSAENKIAVLSSQKMDDAFVRSALQAAGLSDQMTDDIATKVEDTVATNGLTASTLTYENVVTGLKTKLANLVTVLKGFATSTLGIVAILGAVSLGVYKLNKYLEDLNNGTIAMNKALADLEESSSEIETLTADLSDLNDQLSELRNQKETAITNDEDTSQLEVQIGLLERQIALKQQELDLEKQEKASAASEALATETAVSKSYTTENGKTYTWTENQTETDQLAAINTRIESIKAQEAELASIGADNWTEEQAEQAKSLESEYTNLVTQGNELATTISSETQAITDSVDNINDLSNSDHDLVSNGNKVVNSFLEITETAEDTAEAIEEVTESITEYSSVADAIAGVAKLEDGFDMLQSIWEDIEDASSGDSDDIAFDFASLVDEDFTDIFGGYTDAYNTFVDTISSNTTDIDKCRDAFDDLVTEWVNSEGVLDKVTEGTKDSVIAYLDQLGVVNSAEVVTEALARKNQFLAETGKEVSEASVEEVVEFLNVSKAAETTKQYIAALYIQQLDLSNMNFSQAKTREEILSVAKAAGATIAEIEALSKAMSVLSQASMTTSLAKASLSEFTNGSSFLSSSGKTSAKSLVNQYKSAQQEISNILNNIDYSSATDIDIDWSGSSGSSSSSSDSSGSSSDSEDTKETIDWIEVKLERLDRLIDNLQTKVDTTWSSWSNRSAALSKEITKLTKKLNTLKKAYKYYYKYAQSLQITDYGLSASSSNKKIKKQIQKQVQNGSINISDYSSEWADYISDYQTYWEKYLSARDEYTSTESELMEAQLEVFENIMTQYESYISTWQARVDYYESSYKDAIEANGDRLSNSELTTYYNKLNAYLSKIISNEQTELEKLQAQYETLVAEGVSGEELQNLKQEILELQTDLSDNENAVKENTLAILTGKWDNITDGLEYLADTIDNNDFLIKLMEYQDSGDFLDNYGNINSYGTAAEALHLANMSSYENSLSYYTQLLEELEDAYNNGSIGLEEYMSRKQEYIGLYQDAVEGIYEEKEAIMDLIESSYDAQLSYLQELIDTYTDMLDAQKDLYDYEKSIQDKTSAISSYEKQLAALEGDDSEEAKSRRQQIQNSLKDAQEDLEQTEYEKYISDQKEMLQTLYDDAEDYFDIQLADVEARISEVTDAVSSSASSITSTIETVTTEAQYSVDTMTDSLNAYLSSESEMLSYVKQIVELLADGDSSSSSETTQTSSSSTGTSTQDTTDSSAAQSTANGIKTWLASSYNKTTLSSSGVTVDDTYATMAKSLITKYMQLYGLTGKSRSDLKAANRVLYDMSGGKYLTSSLLSQLATQLGFTYDGADYSGIMYQLLRALGYSKGGVVSNKDLDLSALGLTAASDDDKLVLAKEGERILTPAQNEAYEQIGQALLGTDLSSLTNALNYVTTIPDVNSTAGNTITSNVETMTLSFPNVSNYEEFVSQMKSDSNMEKWLQSVTIGQALGKNSLTKNKY